MSDPRLDRAVPFPAARPDAVLRFTTADLIKMATLEKPEPLRPWRHGVVRRLLDEDVGFIRDVVGIGLKTGDGFTPLVLESVDDLTFPPAACVIPIMHALTLAMIGGTYAELVARAEADPPTGAAA